MSQSSKYTTHSDPATLQGRLRTLTEKVIPVPADGLRKYIAYARRYVHPKLTSEAIKVLQSFYVELRQKFQTSDCTPITMRQLESLIRLTEARAKLELREEASETDAIDVVEIMRASMADTAGDPSLGKGGLNFSRSINGAGMSTRGAAKKFVAALEREAAASGRNRFTQDEMKDLLVRSGIKVASFYDLLASLNASGFIIKKGHKEFQIVTVDY